MTENNQQIRVFSSPEISYEEMSLWRDICEYLDGVKYKTLCTDDSPSIPHFSERGGWELVGIGRDRRDALWKFHDCQINLIVWFEDSYDSNWKGWKLAKDWYRKMDWLEKVIVLNRDPESLPKPWIAERQKRERQRKLNSLVFDYRACLSDIRNRLKAINHVVQVINQKEDRRYKEKTLEENMDRRIRQLREQIAEARNLLKQIQEIKAVDFPPYAVLGGQRQPPLGALVLSPNQPARGKNGQDSQQ